MLLAITQRLNESSGSDGFVETTLLYEQCQAAGYAPEQIGFHFQRAFEKNLMEYKSGNSSLGSCRVTTIGSYMHKRMITLFPYIDAVIVDTPIVSSHYRPIIRDVKPIEDRVRRADKFRRYLDEQWIGVKNIANTFDWPTLSSQLLIELEKVAQKANVDLSELGS